MVVNLFFIKNTNGLFYYAIDYVSASNPTKMKVLVRKSLAYEARNYFGESATIGCGYFKFIIHIILAAIKGALIFTPTAHPLPFIKNQIVILHDIYPFLSKFGKIKKFLFLLSARFSNCKLGYINRSVCYSFYLENGFSKKRLIFAPNKFPEQKFQMDVQKQRSKKVITVGLVGTDSEKKNYHKLFDLIYTMGLTAYIHILIYGHATKYYLSLIDKYSDIKLNLVQSNCNSIEEFLYNVDALVSVADNEGFGRPIATAIVSGVPCFLKKSPVFMEFFKENAYFFDSESELLSSVINTWKSSQLCSCQYIPFGDINDAFNSFADFLKIQK